MHNHWIIKIEFNSYKKRKKSARKKETNRFKIQESEGCKIFAGRCYLREYLSLPILKVFVFFESSLCWRRGIHINYRLSIAAIYLTASLPVTNYRFTILQTHHSRFEPFSVKNERDELEIVI